MDISKPIKRFDAEEKISGSAKYIADMEFDDMFYAKTLRSTKARAKIINIEIPKLPKGYFIVDKTDIPGRNRVKIIFYDQPFFAEDIVNYIGEPILLVVGREKNVILDIISKIKIDYEDMEPILSIDEAEKNSKKPIFELDNCFAKYEYSKGNLEKAKKDSIKTFIREYKTGYQEHIYLETQGMTASYENGKIKIWGSMQCPYFVKNAVVEALGCDTDKVQVIQTTTGGGFGGKEEYPSLIAGQVAAAALKSQKTIKLIFDRSEDIECSTKRHPSVIKYKTYIDKNNKILGMDVDIKLDGGAYSGMSSIVLQRSMFAAIGVYNVENVVVKGKVVATNNVISGAFRGFGAPQSFFALEMHMDYIANQLGIDNVEFRRKNILKKGDLSSTSGIFRDYIPLPEIMEKIEQMSDYKNRIRNKSNESDKSDESKLRGIGYAVFFHGGGFTGSGERDIIKAKVKLKKNKYGVVEILISNVEMGQGTQTSLRKIVAATLGISIENVIYQNPDTDRVPDSGPTVASRTTMIIGRLLEMAAKDMKKRWSEEEFDVINQYKHPDGFKWDDGRFVGDAYNVYSWGANIVEVEVNKLTYEVEVKGVWAVFDIGTAIDEKIIQGQIEGGMLQGLGYAGMEVMLSNNGRIQQRTNTDYIIPTSMDFPRIESALVENPYKEGPFGAKSAGELTLIGAPAAYAMAVQDAIGRPLNKIPITPEYLMEVIKNEN
ncbi:aldehyde oxidase [Clostridium polyendosporum]|uniref:Aldehyde oxidase n=1 Tax=Clostridium polyendosporum TaxID=69208 RepID=A0A919VGK3_9CLOT|nr:xanthine dehydrogenase family protein molybdopterin-binding subunit [Clostridium polyendosporum]GIM29267.1 aldehyde oxidase [Clostridium polyendosporum]